MLHFLVIAALEGEPGETEPPPFLLLDEFNACNNVNLSFLDAFMRRCQDKKFYLIILTQNKEMAKQLCNLNDWQKIAPLRSFLEVDYDGVPDPVPEEPD
jgi:hypothetical protein